MPVFTRFPDGAVTLSPAPKEGEYFQKVFEYSELELAGLGEKPPPAIFTLKSDPDTKPITAQQLEKILMPAGANVKLKSLTIDGYVSPSVMAWFYEQLVAGRFPGLQTLVLKNVLLPGDSIPTYFSRLPDVVANCENLTTLEVHGLDSREFSMLAGDEVDVEDGEALAVAACAETIPVALLKIILRDYKRCSVVIGYPEPEVIAKVFCGLENLTVTPTQKLLDYIGALIAQEPWSVKECVRYITISLEALSVEIKPGLTVTELAQLLLHHQRTQGSCSRRSVDSVKSKSLDVARRRSSLPNEEKQALMAQTIEYLAEGYFPGVILCAMKAFYPSLTWRVQESGIIMSDEACGKEAFKGLLQQPLEGLPVLKRHASGRVYIEASDVEEVLRPIVELNVHRDLVLASV